MSQFCIIKFLKWSLDMKQKIQEDITEVDLWWSTWKVSKQSSSGLEKYDGEERIAGHRKQDWEWGA